LSTSLVPGVQVACKEASSLLRAVDEEEGVRGSIESAWNDGEASDDAAGAELQLSEVDSRLLGKVRTRKNDAVEALVQRSAVLDADNEDVVVAVLRVLLASNGDTIDH
jgi:membrane carboxypeptidase/penicillin-binding protein